MRTGELEVAKFCEVNQRYETQVNDEEESAVIYSEMTAAKMVFTSLFVLYPYLTIHMRELGINVEETAIMSAVTPVVAIVMPPIAGMVADRIGNFRILLSVFSSLGGAASLLLLLVPVGRVTVTYPERVIFSVGCGGGRDGYLDLVMSGDPPCSYVPSIRLGKIQQVEMTLEACGFICDSSIGGQVTAVLPAVSTNEKDTSQRILQTTRYDVIVGSRVPNETKETYSYTLSSEEMPETSDTDRDLRSHRFRKNNEFYRTSVRSASNNSYFFPTTGLYNLSCVLVDAKYDCRFGKNASAQGAPKVQTPRERFKTSLFLANKSNNMFLATGLSNWVATETGNGSATSRENANATCSDVYTQAGRKVSVSVPLQDPDRTVQLSSCRARCLVTAPRQDVCSNLEIEETYDISLTFWSYLAIRVFIGMIGGTAFAMFEGAVIAILREQNADYGLQRIYATIGGMISSPLSGLLIDYASRGKGYTDFRPAFYLYAGLKIASGLLMLTMNLEFKSPATNVLSDVMSVIRNVEIVALFIAIFVLGTAWGYIESFLFWLLQDLGASRSLMGITITVGGVAGIPLLVLSGPIIDKIGHANVLFIGFIFYAIRLFGYSLIYNPWLCLIFEAMESVTSSLSFTAAVTYAAKLSTTTTDSSVQGLLGGLYFGVGKGAGSLIGGYMMKAFDTRPTYRIFAVACTVTGILYFLFNKFYLRKRPQVRTQFCCSLHSFVNIFRPMDSCIVPLLHFGLQQHPSLSSRIPTSRKGQRSRDHDVPISSFELSDQFSRN
ncbi:uncharacterized protein LOC111868499 [Cryptotermes secundus]|uniref:uncharacterized protein LOC111868499 n=1 Tax=Cryptotermes secundus TaxID=105785 RepID=UPI000CD7DD71|nr:uncharacterized protein LOC111868499 [Cryptotermes secundus]